MGRDIRIEEVNGGYMLRAWKGDFYGPMGPEDGKQNEMVVTTKSEVRAQLDKWLEGEAPPFKKGE